MRPAAAGVHRGLPDVLAVPALVGRRVHPLVEGDEGRDDPRPRRVAERFAKPIEQDGEARLGAMPGHEAGKPPSSRAQAGEDMRGMGAAGAQRPDHEPEGQRPVRVVLAAQAARTPRPGMHAFLYAEMHVQYKRAN